MKLSNFKTFFYLLIGAGGSILVAAIIGLFSFASEIVINQFSYASAISAHIPNCQKCGKDLVCERCVNQEEYWGWLGYPIAEVSVRLRSHETPELGKVISYFS